jgi:chromosome segregation ATPase
MESITVDSFMKRVKALEGFNVIVEDETGPAAGNKQVAVALTKKRSPSDWSVNTWIEKRVSKQSLDTLNISVRWGNKKSKPQTQTLLKNIRDSYPTSFGRDANDASKVQQKLEEAIRKHQVKLTKLKRDIKQKKIELDAQMLALVTEFKQKRARLATEIKNLETERNELSLQLKDKTKLAEMTEEQIDKTARKFGRERAKEESAKALNNAFSTLPRPYEGLMNNIRKILDVDDFDTNALVSTLVARLNDAKWDVDNYMNQNRELRMQIAAARR